MMAPSFIRPRSTAEATASPASVLERLDQRVGIVEEADAHAAAGADEEVAVARGLHLGLGLEGQQVGQEVAPVGAGQPVGAAHQIEVADRPVAGVEGQGGRAGEVEILGPGARRAGAASSSWARGDSASGWARVRAAKAPRVLRAGPAPPAVRARPPRRRGCGVESCRPPWRSSQSRQPVSGTAASSQARSRRRRPPAGGRSAASRDSGEIRLVVAGEEAPRSGGEGSSSGFPGRLRGRVRTVAVLRSSSISASRMRWKRSRVFLNLSCSSRRCGAQLADLRLDAGGLYSAPRLQSGTTPHARCWFHRRPPRLGDGDH